MIKYKLLLLTVFFSIKQIVSVHISSGPSAISKESLHILKGVSSPIQCSLRCNQRGEDAFYGNDGLCGCLSKKNITSSNQPGDELSGYKYFQV